MRRKLAANGILALVCAAAVLASESSSVPKPGAKDLCPVCGMIVAGYPNWVAVVEWTDNRVLYFDGAKDLIKFLQALPKYAPGRRREQIRRMTVTEFYELKRIDATKALFVLGSDVMGPMGHELIPLATRADAEEFRKDHKGKRVLPFHEITPEVIAQLDSGRFD